MGSINVIRRWITLLLAEVLNVSASVAELLLRSQPRWLAQLRLLEEDLRHAGQSSDRATADAAKAGTSNAAAGSDLQPDTTRQLLEAYAILNRALRDLEARGLALDEGLVERMRDDWNRDSIISYLQSSEAQLRKAVTEALDEAAAALGVADALVGCPREAAKVAPPAGSALTATSARGRKAAS